MCTGSNRVQITARLRQLQLELTDLRRQIIVEGRRFLSEDFANREQYAATIESRRLTTIQLRIIELNDRVAGIRAEIRQLERQLS